MFDVGFSEMMVIAVIALIVLGPEKLPKVARTLGHLLGRMQRYVNDVKSDINREIELDDLRKLQSSMQETARSIEQTVKSEAGAVESEFNKVSQSVQGAVSSETPAPAYPENPVAELPEPVNNPSPQLELGLNAEPSAPAKQP